MPQKYPKPPIVEAVLHVRYGAALSDGDLKRIPKLLLARYPKSKPESDYRLEVTFKPAPTGAAPKPQIVDSGARLLSDNDQKVVVTRSQSVIFAYHAPYAGWDEFLTSAKYVFETLRDKLGFRQVTSVGLRYVNRLDIPVPPTGLEINPSSYLLAGVSLPQNKISSTIRNFQAVADVLLNHDRLVARVGVATLEPALIQYVSMLLDIDIIAEHEIPQKEIEFWRLVERMRDSKNEIFETCITDEARKLFGWKP